MQKYLGLWIEQRGLPLASPISAGQAGWTMYFTVFLDESGKVHKNDFTSLCGYVADPGTWADFTTAWDRLRFHWGVPPIHTAPIMRAEKQDPKNEWTPVYKRITAGGIPWDKWRDDMLKDFATMVCNSALVCVGAAVDVVAYKKIQRLPKCKLTQRDTSVFCLQECLGLALDKIKVVDSRPSVTLVLDDDQENAYDYYQNFKVLRSVYDRGDLKGSHTGRFEEYKNCIRTIAFGQDTFHPALQASDMISHQTRRFKVEQKIGTDIEPSDLYALLTFGGQHQPKFYNEDHLLQLAQNTHAALDALKENENCEGM